jgi:hypothetical protein
MVYLVPVYFPDGTQEIYRISEEYFREEKLDRGTNLEAFIEEVYGAQVNVGYPSLSQAEGEDSL